jgi:hypothetical protein
VRVKTPSAFGWGESYEENLQRTYRSVSKSYSKR